MEKKIYTLQLPLDTSILFKILDGKPVELKVIEYFDTNINNTFKMFYLFLYNLISPDYERKDNYSPEIYNYLIKKFDIGYLNYNIIKTYEYILQLILVHINPKEIYKEYKVTKMRLDKNRVCHIDLLVVD